MLDVYTGKTAAGVERDISKVRVEDWSVLFPNFKNFPFKPGKYADVTFDMELSASLPMEVATAKAAKSNLRLLVIFDLKEPYIQVFKNHVYPKLDDPEERLIRFHYLGGQVKELWFYNYETGEIYTKVRPSANISESNVRPRGRNLLNLENAASRNR